MIQRFLPWYTSSAVFLFFAFPLAFPSLFGLSAILIVVGALGLINIGKSLALEKGDYVFIFIFLFYFATCVAINLLHHAIGREYDVPVRFALAIPAFLLLIAYPPKASFFWSGIIVGALSSGVFAVWQADLGAVRTGGYTNPIQYGNICIILGIACLTGIKWAQSQTHDRLWTFSFVIGFLVATLGTILTGSRGSWIALPVGLIALYIFYGPALKLRIIALGLVAVVAGCAAMYLLPQTGIKQRVDLAVQETSGYFSEGNSSTSVGTRLEMWRMGLEMFPEHPWLGWGKQGYMQHNKELAEAGLVGETTIHHSHLHNEYIDALVKRGLIGLSATLLLFFVPFVFLGKKLKHCSREAHPYIVLGMTTCLLYWFFGLTQAFLTHNNGVLIFLFIHMIAWALARKDNVSHLSSEATARDFSFTH